MPQTLERDLQRQANSKMAPNIRMSVRVSVEVGIILFISLSLMFPFIYSTSSWRPSWNFLSLVYLLGKTELVGPTNMLVIFLASLSKQ